MRHFLSPMTQTTSTSAFNAYISIGVPQVNGAAGIFPPGQSYIPATTGIAGSYSTSGFYIGLTTQCAVQALYTGNINGTLSLSSSNDGVNYDVITGSTTGINQNFNGSTGHMTWNIPFPGYSYILGNWVNASASTGMLAFNLYSKGNM